MYKQNLVVNVCRQDIGKLDRGLIRSSLRDNGATSKIDVVFIEHGGLPHVLALAVHLGFFLVDK